jgi:predicted signal transduction protein with EAL and GGDEF domain
VIALAHGLRIGVVAEGIETEAQFEILREMGCDTGQGYLFARPLPETEAARLLAPGRSNGSTRAVPTLLNGTAKAVRGSARVRASRARVRAERGAARGARPS